MSARVRFLFNVRQQKFIRYHTIVYSRKLDFHKWKILIVATSAVYIYLYEYPCVTRWLTRNIWGSNVRSAWFSFGKTFFASRISIFIFHTEKTRNRWVDIQVGGLHDRSVHFRLEKENGQWAFSARRQIGWQTHTLKKRKNEISCTKGIYVCVCTYRRNPGNSGCTPLLARNNGCLARGAPSRVLTNFPSQPRTYEILSSKTLQFCRVWAVYRISQRETCLSFLFFPRLNYTFVKTTKLKIGPVRRCVTVLKKYSNRENSVRHCYHHSRSRCTV